jgi:integrase
MRTIDSLMNTTIVEQYLASSHGKKDLSPAWAFNKTHLTRRFLSYLIVDPEQCSTDDLLKTFAAIRRAKFKQNYRRQLISTGKSFSLWLAKKNPKINIQEIHEVETPKTQWKTKKPEDMFTGDELKQIIEAAWNNRDKCLLAMLYDGSNRPIELLRLKWRDIIFDEYGAYFITAAKTDKERRIRLTNISLPYLDIWRGKHPDPLPDQYVFCTINKSHIEGRKSIRPLTIDNVQRIIRDVKKRTGIQKLKASLFRPSRITADVKAGVELAYIMKKNWGSLKTKMIDLYTNLDAGYMDEVALGAAGMERKHTEKEKNIYKVEPPICPACGEVNVLGAKYCKECRVGLTEEAQKAIQSKEEKMFIRFKEWMRAHPEDITEI